MCLALLGGVSPHTQSIRRSTETTSPAYRRSAPSRARSRRPSLTVRSPSSTSSGPRIRNTGCIPCRGSHGSGSASTRPRTGRASERFRPCRRRPRSACGGAWSGCGVVCAHTRAWGTARATLKGAIVHDIDLAGRLDRRNMLKGIGAFTAFGVLAAASPGTALGHDRRHGMHNQELLDAYWATLNAGMAARMATSRTWPTCTQPTGRSHSRIRPAYTVNQGIDAIIEFYGIAYTSSTATSGRSTAPAGSTVTSR